MRTPLAHASSCRQRALKLATAGTAAAGSYRPTNWIQRVNKKFRGKPHTFRRINKPLWQCLSKLL